MFGEKMRPHISQYSYDLRKKQKIKYSSGGLFFCIKRIQNGKDTTCNIKSDHRIENYMQRTVGFCDYQIGAVPLKKQILIKKRVMPYGKNSGIHQKTYEKSRGTHPSFDTDTTDSEYAQSNKKKEETATHIYKLKGSNIAFHIR